MPSCTKCNRTIVGLLAAFPVAVFAVQPDAGQLLNQQQQLQRNRLERIPQEDVKRGERSVPKEAGGIKVRVEAVRFSGDVAVFGENELQALVSDAIGSELDFNGLQALADRVSEYLKDKGYFLAHAYLPKQYLTGGVIDIAVLAGRLQATDDAVTILGRLRISPQRLKWIAEGPAKPGEVVRQKDLERAVLLINDLPGIAANSNIERGKDPGTVHLVVNADEAPLFSGTVGLDDFGNRYTGTWRANAQLNVNDPLRIGDQLSLSVTGAADFQVGQLTYNWPINYYGVRASISYSGMHYSIGQDLSDLKASGSSSIAGGGVSYPVIRTRNLNLWSSVNFASKSLQDEAFSEKLRDKHVNAWNAVLSGDSYDRLGGGGVNNFSVAATSGDLDLSKVATDLALDQNSGAHTNGPYTKLDYNLARLQRIAPRLSLFAALNGQLASKNLDSSEKFFLGGPMGVRAYPIGEGAGDQGWVTNIELRYDLPVLTALGDLQWIGFVDAGQITLHKSPWPSSINTATGANSYMLSGVGMGLNLTKGRNYALRSAWATKIGSNRGRSAADLNSDGQRDHSRFWLYGVLWF